MRGIAENMMQNEEPKRENPAFSQFTGAKYLVIESYKRDGTAVKTAVWFIANNGTLYVRTDNDTGKVKRIRRDSHIRIALCNARGTPKGSWVDAKAEVANGPEAEDAYLLLKKKYGLQYRAVRFMGRLTGRKSKAVVLGIKPEDNLRPCFKTFLPQGEI